MIHHKHLGTPETASAGTRQCGGHQQGRRPPLLSAPLASASGVTGDGRPIILSNLLILIQVLTPPVGSVQVPPTSPSSLRTADRAPGEGPICQRNRPLYRWHSQRIGEKGGKVKLDDGPRMEVPSPRGYTHRTKTSSHSRSK